MELSALRATYSVAGNPQLRMFTEFGLVAASRLWGFVLTRLPQCFDTPIETRLSCVSETNDCFSAPISASHALPSSLPLASPMGVQQNKDELCAQQLRHAQHGNAAAYHANCPAIRFERSPHLLSEQIDEAPDPTSDHHQAQYILGQDHVAPELLQMRAHDCPSEGLRPLWRVDPDLERDPDSRQHATQHNDLERLHCFVKSRHRPSTPRPRIVLAHLRVGICNHGHTARPSAALIANALRPQ